MGETLSVQDGACTSNGEPVPSDAVLIAQLIQLVSQRPQQHLLLPDLDALLPGSVRQRARDQGGLRCWLLKYPTVFTMSDTGIGAVSLTNNGALQSAAYSAVETPTRNDFDSPGKSSPDRDGGAGFDEEIDGHAALQLRGLPYKATAEDVHAFLDGHAAHLCSENPIYLMLNRDGRPSGFARVTLVSPEAARRCRDELHLKAMDDRYVEVFIYSERPSRGRQRRGPQEEETPEKTVRTLPPEAAGITRVQVVRECRTQMADVKRRRLMLSMLGEALSAGVRSYLKHMYQGLKNFLAEFPNEFSVDGGKGCEYVTYTPIQLFDAIDGLGPGAASPELGPCPPPATQPIARTLFKEDDPQPQSPQPKREQTMEPHPTPGDGHMGLATPSTWGTPQVGFDSLPPWPQPVATDTTLPSYGGNSAAAAAASAAAACLQSGSWAPPPAWPTTALWPNWPGQFAAAPWSAPPAILEGVKTVGTGELPSPFAALAEVCAREAAAPAPGAPAVASPRTASALASTTASSESSPEVCREANVVRLRGLPFSATKQDILTFFAQYEIVDRIVSGGNAVNLLLRANGRSSGQARVQMKARSDAEMAQRLLHGQWMGNRYIEVFLSNDDSQGDTAAQGSSGPGEVSRTPSKSGTPAVLQPQALPSPCATLQQQQHQQAVAEVAAAAAFQALSAPWLQQQWSSPAMLPGLEQSPSLPPNVQTPIPDAGNSYPSVSWEALFDFLDPEAAAAADAAWRGMGAGTINYPAPPTATASS
jgi:RNA recognition motif-containing protein